MPPRLSLLRSTHNVLTRPSSSIVSKAVTPYVLRCIPFRGYSDSEKPPHKPNGPNQDVLPHATEEAAALGEITGEGGPEIEQGTPVQEVGQLDSTGV